MMHREQILTMHRQILLTGATGALGPALAAELARANAAEKIAVMMRGEKSELQNRFEEWMGEVRTVLPEDERDCLGRLYPVSGDICRDDLGFDESNLLQRETDIVMHAAADTNFSAPQDKQWDVNVGGTRRMLAWAGDCPKLARFILVSSVFVSGSRTGRIDETLTTKDPGFVTHYQRTKWEAEHLALASGLPVGVARISLILGSHATGGVHRTGAVHSLIKWFSRGLVPMMPGLPDSTGDLIATELATQTLTRAVLADWKSADKPIWHIAAAEKAPKMSELIDFVYGKFADRTVWKRRGIPRPRMVEQNEFNSVIETFNASGRTNLAQAMRSVNTFLPDLFYPKTYETTRAEELWGGKLPEYDWRETMDRVIRVLCPADK
jgi:thioester reductase-like protein